MIPTNSSVSTSSVSSNSFNLVIEKLMIPTQMQAIPIIEKIDSFNLVIEKLMIPTVTVSAS